MEVQEDLLADIYEEINKEPASTGKRFFNYLIDIVVFYFISFSAGVLFADFFNTSGILGGYAFAYTLYVAYYTVIEGATAGKSIGKMITGTRAVRIDGSPITWNDAFLRSLSRIVPFEQFSAFGGRPWHDRWTSTKVVNNMKL